MNTTTTTTPNKSFKNTKVKIELGSRITRKGKLVELKELYKDMDPLTKERLSSLNSKFGINWSNAFVDTFSKEQQKKYNFKTDFVIKGNTKKGLPISFDRFQSTVFLNGKRLKSTEVLKLNKRKFEKLEESLT